jgi:Uma2 family endonuclease
VGVETTLYLAEMLFVEPDLMLYPHALEPQALSGSDVTLLIEVSDDSLSRDLGLKASIYADHGVRDYWVVDVEARRVITRRAPTDDHPRVHSRSCRRDLRLRPDLTPCGRPSLAWASS